MRVLCRCRVPFPSTRRNCPNTPPPRAIGARRPYRYRRSYPPYRSPADLSAEFFAQANCPALKLADVFLEAADDYHLDWRLLPSLSYVETGGGKAAYNNNLFGWASGKAHFDNLAAGIHQVGFQLSHRRPYRHKNVAQILAIYNPRPEYAQRVTAVMRQIAPTE